MWSLHSLHDAEVVYYLPIGRDYTIGRKDCDIMVSDDQSISRRHAVISVQTARIHIEDSSSKYGTAVNKNKITSTHALQHNDVIRFGQGITVFKLVHQQLMFCCSNMSASEKQFVKDHVQKLGGHMLSSWSSGCTHLVMTAITVVNALSNCCPIISVTWLEDAVRCFEQKMILPQTNKYIPKLIDSNVTSSNVALKPSFSRRKLFSGKTIYFFDKKQYSSLSFCLKASGGKTILLSDVTQLNSELLNNNNILIVDHNNLTSNIKQLINEHEIRLISESEIGFAIVHSSTDYYCNSRVSVGLSQLSTHLPTPSVSQQQELENVPIYNTQDTQTSILAYNTVDETDRPHRSPPDIASEKEESKVDESLIKQKRIDDIFEQQPSSSLEARNDGSFIETSTQQSNVTILAPDSCPLSLSAFKRPRIKETTEMESPVKKKQKLDTPNCSTLSKTPTSFLTTRKQTQHSPQGQTSVSNRGHPSASNRGHPSASNNGTSQDTENPIPLLKPLALFEGMTTQRTKKTDEPVTVVNNAKITESVPLKSTVHVVTDCPMTGFISSRKKQTTEQEQLHDEFVDLPTANVIVETVDLVNNNLQKKKDLNEHSLTDTRPNFKRFKKVIHPYFNIRSTSSRVIGINELIVYK